MRTAKQIAASRRNAKKSTGPRSPEGKAASRLNALKHGIFAASQIIFDETIEDLDALAHEYHAQYHAAGAGDRDLVDALVHNDWRLRRMRDSEARVWELAGGGRAGDNPAEAFVKDSRRFARLRGVVNSCERHYCRASQDLSARAHGLQSRQSTTSSGKLASLFQNSQGPLAARALQPPQGPLPLEPSPKIQ